jgi:hypothetical protein
MPQERVGQVRCSLTARFPGWPAAQLQLDARALNLTSKTLEINCDPAARLRPRTLPAHACGKEQAAAHFPDGVR